MSKIYIRFLSQLKPHPISIFYRKHFLGNWIKSLSVTSVIILTGCSTYSETFDCPPGSGVGCKSISEVDQMIDEGKLIDEKPTPAPPIELVSYKPIIREELSIYSPSTSQTASQGMTARTVSRTPERHLRVWIAAFEDGKGNLYSESFVYTVFKPGEWRLRDQMKEQTNNESIKS